jgi:hypothetical protein
MLAVYDRLKLQYYVHVWRIWKLAKQALVLVAVLVILFSFSSISFVLVIMSGFVSWSVQWVA